MERIITQESSFNESNDMHYNGFAPVKAEYIIAKEKVIIFNYLYTNYKLLIKQYLI